MLDEAWCQHCIAEAKAQERKSRAVIKVAEVKKTGWPKVKRIPSPVNITNEQEVREAAAVARSRYRIFDSNGRKYSRWTTAPANIRCKANEDHTIIRGEPLIASLKHTRTDDKPVWVCSGCWKEEGGAIRYIADDQKEEA